MKKILFLIHDLGHGGAEKVLVNLVNNLNKSKFDVTVISLFGGGVNESFLNKDVHYYSVFKKSFPGNSHFMKLFSPAQLHRWFVKDKYDVEIAYLEGPSSRIISGCTNSKTKLISWIHVEQHTEKTAAQSFRSFRESIECYKKYNQIICVSDYVKKDFLNIYPMIDNISTLYNTNETAQILQMKQEEVELDLFNENELKLCGVGKIMPSKGFDRLARIHRRLINEGLPIHTYILGIGKDQEKIEKYITDNKLNSSFTFLGYQTNPYKYVAKCDLFVCASFAEGFSTATTEALIVGTPVCTVEVSGMKEMLGENDEYGLVVDNDEEALYQGIKKLITDKELLSHYKQKAIERGKRFSTEETVKAVEEMLMSSG
ncbi:MAG: glycosyltransferase [Erysipelotrichaceae bacterium]|nr:glycosyltransferase [Erysipelotrichaceae bacterium]